MKCERCRREVTVTIDIWVQGFNHGPEEGDAKSFEIGGDDYVMMCDECWNVIETFWDAFVAMVRREPFEQWKAAVNAGIVDRLGVETDDLVDLPYREYYDQGMSVEAVVEEVVDFADQDFGGLV
jgi:hypothetical protein